MEVLNSKELKTWIDQGEQFTLINVLSAENFNKSHIPDSINIPVATPDFGQEVEEKTGGKGKNIVVYCANLECQASPKAAKKLEEAGFTNVYDFEGGMKEWKDNEFLVEPMSPTTEETSLPL